jgi:hypothetical protein
MTRISTIAPKLRKLLLMLSSDQPGEVVAAVSAIERTLQAAGTDWHDLASELTKPATPAHDRAAHDRHRRHDDCVDVGSGDWRPLHEYCRSHLDALSSREQDFMVTLDFWSGDVTPKQRTWLEAIHARLQRAGL